MLRKLRGRLGSTGAQQQACGSPNYFCPEGVRFRQIVSAVLVLGRASTIQLTITMRRRQQPNDRATQATIASGEYDTRDFALQVLFLHSAVSEWKSLLLPSRERTALGVPSRGVWRNFRTSVSLTATVSPEPCPAGYLGNTTGLTTKACSKLCTSAYCSPALCPAGYYCPLGTIKAVPCGGAGVYCPQGSSVPTAVSIGYYTITTTTLNGDAAALYVPGAEGMLTGLSTRVAQVPCEPGTFCINGVKQLCPAGTYGATSGLASPVCTAPCPPGYYWCSCRSSGYIDYPCVDPAVYCSGGNAVPTTVSVGYYSALGFDGQWVKLSVHPGRFVLSASLIRALGEGDDSFASRICVFWRLCARGGLPDEFHLCLPKWQGTYAVNGKRCVPCQPGFWCGTGSSSPRQNECGGANVFCPLGSSNPVVVQTGYYAANPGSLDGRNADFTAQSICAIQQSALFPQCPSITNGSNSLF
ncbi:hypothetical protein ACHHYP_04245 [Achlya hypogyna]|uniref:Uncharacterized protein n=1 Tax=Achlya hypogyna TaxID=1202772 RepID=A0A1V9ZPD0_ACHHY|nr:hypothetical protein ACHHYP_04245 [Achlya hypogyna]